MVILRTVLLAALMSGCSSTGSLNTPPLEEVYVADFGSSDIESCGPSDVDLTHKQAHDFFKRSKVINKRILHDHYDYAPCYIEGTLKYQGKVCEWEIRAGATGHIQCPGEELLDYACDDCEDLFGHH